MRKQGIVLEHETDPPLLRCKGPARSREQGIAQPDFTAVDRFQTGDQAKQGALAAAGRAQQGGNLTGPQCQAGLGDSLTRPIGPRYGMDGQDRGSGGLYHVASGRAGAIRQLSHITPGRARATSIRAGQPALARRSSRA